MDAETNLFRITQRCSGPFDSRAERGNDHNPHGCQMTDELGVMQQGLIFLGQGVYAVLNSGIFLCEYQSVPEIVGLKIGL